MKIFLKMLVASAILLTAYQSQAQDVIHKKNGQVIEAKIVELGTVEIKYKQSNEPDGPIYVVEKQNITKIIFGDGRTEFYGEIPMDATEFFQDQKKAAIKVSFFGPLVGYTNITYERNIRPGRSWEAKACLIGLGRRVVNESVGFIGTYAYKFYKKPTFYTSDMKRSHILQGGYIKPEVFTGYTTFNDIFDGGTNTFERRESFTGGLLLNIGKEWVFDDAFVLDLSVGGGYGFGESYSVILVVPDTGLALNFAINVGWTIK